MPQPQLSIRYRDPRKLRARPNNPRTHSARQIKQIAASIQEFGFVSPVLVDGGSNIIAGHARVEAAILLGMADVPTVRVDNLSPTQIRAYVIADNKLAENAGWDRSLLAIELQELSVELNFDVTVTGFEMAEVDIAISEEADRSEDELDEIPQIDQSVPPVSRVGDLWKIGDHYLLCGDALLQESYEHLLRGRKAQMVFSDPPFNVRIFGHVSGRSRKSAHREFPMASGEMTSEQFEKFLDEVFHNIIKHSDESAISFVCMDWRHIREIANAGHRHFAELKNVCVWSKSNGGMGSLYRSKHELVFVFKNGAGKHINNVELGRFGRNRTNIWNYPGGSSFGEERSENLEMHPTTKPVALVADAILDCSRRGGIVLDAFVGSGTTLLAAEQTGRRGYGIELDPAYVDLTLSRIRKRLGLEVTHVQTALSFDELRAQRNEGHSHGKKAAEQANRTAPSRRRTKPTTKNKRR